jgi:hypothetical protein
MKGGRPILERMFGIDLRALATVRIGLGLVLLIDLASRANHFRAGYTDAGAVPRDLLDPWLTETIAPLHLLSGGFAWPALLFGLALVSALMLVLGVRARLAAVVSWLLLVSLQVRNPFVLNFGDDILRLCLFWALFLPLDRRAALGRERVPGTAGVECSLASAAFLLQVCFVYFFTAVLKRGADWHGDGTALYYALQFDLLARPLGLWLGQFVGFTQLVTWATLALEYVGPFLLIAPHPLARVAAVAAFCALHLAISATMRLGVFPWIDVTVLLAFLPREAWDWLEGLGWRLMGSRDGVPEAPATSAVASGGGLSRARSVVVGALLLLVFVENLASAWPGQTALAPVNRVGRFLGLQQNWQMFAPFPPRDGGWFVMPGRVADGRLVDLSPHGPELTWRKPESVSGEMPSARWGFYLLQNRFPDQNGPVRRGHARWLCSQWNRAHPAAERLLRVDIFFMLEASTPPGVEPRVVSRHLASHECPAPGAAPAPGWDLAVRESGPQPRPVAAPPFPSARPAAR